MRQITQFAPWPDELEDLVERFRYRPGWTFKLHESLVRDREDPNDFDSPPVAYGTTLDIITWGYNSYHCPNRGEWAGIGNPADSCSDCGEPWPCTSYQQSERNPDYRPPYRVHHYRIVPAATFNRQSWEHWLLQQCLAVEQHETFEFARVEYEIGGERLVERPFRPVHAPGWDPYMLTVAADEEHRRTSYRGQLNVR